MKTVLIVITAMIVLIPSCQKKAVPVITERNAPPPKVPVFDYPPKETVAPDTVAGKRIFMNRCGRCHALPAPDQFNSKMWDTILELMFARAGLNNEQGLHVRTWVLANAKTGIGN